MSTPVVVVDPDITVAYSMALMRRRRIHGVVVEVSLKSAQHGIVTAADIRDKIAAAGRDPADTRVREIMSGPIVTGRAEQTFKECSQVMRQHKIHLLPVADEHNTLVGLISAADIFSAVEESGWDEDNCSA